MTTAFRVPRGSVGIKMPDGTKYDRGRGDLVHVDDRHAGEVARSTGTRAGYVSSGAPIFRGTGWECPCGREAWAWQHTCPGCGAPKQEEAAA